MIGSTLGSAARRLSSGRRRWWLRATVAVLVGGLAFLLTPKPYVARADILLLAPNGDNPYLGYNPSIVSTVNILLLKVQDSPTILAPQTTFTVVLDDSINEPMIIATTNDASAARAQAGLRVLEKYTTDELTSIQRAAGVAPRYSIHAQVITQTPVAEITRYNAIERGILAAPLAFFVMVGVGSAVRRRPQSDTGPLDVDVSPSAGQLTSASSRA